MRFISLVIFLTLGTASAGHTQTINGKVTRVIDGDTIEINELRIRLCGIDAPEDHEPGAAEAQHFVELLVRNEFVRCVVVGGGTVCDTRSDVINNRRVVAQCFHRGSDLAATITEAGHACDWPKYSNGAYAAAECQR